MNYNKRKSPRPKSRANIMLDTLSHGSTKVIPCRCNLSFFLLELKHFYICLAF